MPVKAGPSRSPPLLPQWQWTSILPWLVGPSGGHHQIKQAAAATSTAAGVVVFRTRARTRAAEARGRRGEGTGQGRSKRPAHAHALVRGVPATGARLPKSRDS